MQRHVAGTDVKQTARQPQQFNNRRGPKSDSPQCPHCGGCPARTAGIRAMAAIAAPCFLSATIWGHSAIRVCRSFLHNDSPFSLAGWVTRLGYSAIVLGGSLPKRLTQAWRLTELDRPVGLVVKAFASGAEDSTGSYVDIAVNAVCLFVGCLTSQQHASVSQGRICTDNFTCCHTETEAADQTFYLTQSQYTDTGPTSPSADPISPGAWHGRLNAGLALC